jgi:hypothetical protein
VTDYFKLFSDSAEYSADRKHTADLLCFQMIALGDGRDGDQLEKVLPEVQISRLATKLCLFVSIMP